MNLELESDKMVNVYAAISAEIVQNVFVSQCYQQNRQFSTHSRGDYFAPYKHILLPSPQGKLAWSGISSMQLRTLTKHQSDFIIQRNIHCNGLFQILIIQVDIKCKNIYFKHIQDTSLSAPLIPSFLYDYYAFMCQ